MSKESMNFFSKVNVELDKVNAKLDIVIEEQEKKTEEARKRSEEDMKKLAKREGFETVEELNQYLDKMLEDFWK